MGDASNAACARGVQPEESAPVTSKTLRAKTKTFAHTRFIRFLQGFGCGYRQRFLATASAA